MCRASLGVGESNGVACSSSCGEEVGFGDGVIRGMCCEDVAAKEVGGGVQFRRDEEGF